MSKNNSLSQIISHIKNEKLSSAFIVFRVFLVYKYSLFKTKILSFLIRQTNIKIENFILQVDRTDSGISRELMIYKKREHHSFNYIRDNLKKNDIIIDIGSNIGYYAIPEAKTTLNGEVYAIEPVSDNFQLLKKNLGLNNVKNCYPHQLAIGDKNQRTKINIYQKKNWSSFNQSLPSEILRKETVQVKTLDNFIKENLKNLPTFIRMDVEGFELPILLGARKLLKQTDNLRIMMEIHPHFLADNGVKKMLKLLKENNFAISRINLEISPSLWKYRKLYNRYRKISEILPYGIVDKKNYNYAFLQQMLLAKDFRGKCVYHPHVVFEKTNNHH